MSTKICLAIITAISAGVICAENMQSYDPLVTEGKHWFYIYGVDLPDLKYDWEYYELYFEGDTAISGIEYKRLIAKYHFYDNPQVTKTAAYLREEERKVYAVAAQEKVLNIEVTKQFGVAPFYSDGPYYDLTGEILIYDFSDTPFNGSEYIPKDSTDYQGNKRRFFVHQPTGIPVYIEGIGQYAPGNMTTFVHPVSSVRCSCSNNITLAFSHVTDDEGNIIYSTYSPICESFKQDYDGNAEDSGCFMHEVYQDYLTRSGSSSVSLTEAGLHDIIRQSDGFVTISRPGKDNVGLAVMYNLDGNIVNRWTINQDIVTIPTANMPIGVYLIQYYDDSLRINKKIVIK